MKGDVFNSGEFDGIIGLSYPDQEEGIPTIVDDMID